MRHGDKINNLSRTASHRKALLRNLSCALIEHKRIFTTLAKAKALRKFVEPIITKSKNDTTHNRRLAFSALNNKDAVKELFAVVSDKVADRPGGYTRIIKLQPRTGDAAEMAMIELVDFNELYTKEEKKKTTRRSRRGSKKATTATKETATVATESKVTQEAAATTDSAEAPAKDKLTKVEGIGPKAQEVFYAAGIHTFADIAAKTAEELKTILDESEGNFKLSDPTTWPQQAQLAADGKWDEFKELTDRLKGGREEA